MKQDNSKIKYFLYARKSSESEDRQVQSIDDQVKRLKEVARDFDLKIISVYTEAKSAKQPNNRPVFEKMMKRIEVGEADGILCWQINRLSRNPVDSGRIGWLLQQGTLKAIQTTERQYLPQDNVLLFSVETGMANQFILDLSKSVKRGIQGKLERGWKPGAPSHGYQNEVVKHTIIKDQERFDLLRKAWNIMLTGNYSMAQILDKLNNEWGFRTRQFRRKGGTPLSLSGLYKIFTDLFYTGIIVHKGQQYQGKHEPMITLDEFDQVQIILGRKGKPRPKKHSFPFTGIMRCGECGCMITAETKTKRIKDINEIKNYTYYHCTKRKVGIHCSQSSIEAEVLNKQINGELAKYTILPEFRNWALKILRNSNDKEISARTAIYESQHRTLVSTQRQLDNLTQMRYRELINDEEYSRERNSLQEQIQTLEARLRETEGRADNWLKLTEGVFDFAATARNRFMNGNPEVKREILTGLGSNFILKDGKLSIQAFEWLQPIANSYPALEKEYVTLELNKSRLDNAKSEALSSLLTTWRGW